MSGESDSRASGRSTQTSAFGVSRREAHDASSFYARFTPPIISDDVTLGPRPELETPCIVGDARNMQELPDNCVALVVTSPPYFVGKEYENEAMLAAKSSGDAAVTEVPASYREYLDLLHGVFGECVRVLEPGGRIAVNVANLGRKPYRSLSADVIRIFEELGLLLRGEIIWQKGRGASGSCAWGSFASPANPVLRDISERVIVASKGRFDRAHNRSQRAKLGLPSIATLTNDEFVDTTLDLWEIDPESARRVGHPAPFPVALPLKLIDLYTYVDDLVLDPFLGAGTTLVAAAMASRHGVGYDLDPAYCELAKQRLEEVVVRPLPGEAKTVDPYAQALAEGRNAMRLATTALERAGFGGVKAKPKFTKLGIGFDLLVHDDTGRPYYIDVAGACTTVKPGLQQPDVWWHSLGLAQMFSASKDRGVIPHDARLLVLTPALPRTKSDADRALRALRPDKAGIFDVVALFDPAGESRLAAYARGAAHPYAGFWPEEPPHLPGL